MKDLINTYLTGEAARVRIETVLYTIWSEVLKPGAKAVLAAFPPYARLPYEAHSLNDRSFGSFELAVDTVTLHTSTQYGDSDDQNSFTMPRHIIESDDPMASARVWAGTYFEGLMVTIQTDIDTRVDTNRAAELAQLKALQAKYSTPNP